RHTRFSRDWSSDVCSSDLITHGKIGVLIENSPSAIIAPATFFSFLESTEDRYMRWQSGTFFRFLRFISMFFAITVTPAYVAVVTDRKSVVSGKTLWFSLSV